jgi:hypothetical protein
MLGSAATIRAVAGLAHDLEIVLGTQHAGQSGAHDGVIVDDQDPQRHGRQG